MKLLRKTLDLFLGQPAIWLTYLGARWLVACLGWVRKSASDRIIEWCPTGHSVLGGAAFQNCGENWELKLTLTRLVRSGFEFADRCIYTVMLVAIALIVGAILRGETPALKTIASAPRPSLGRILVYSIKIWFLGLILSVLIYEPSYTEAVSKHFSAQWVSYAFTAGQSVLSTVCYVWIMVPLAIALLRPAGAGVVPVEEKRLGRLFLILTGLAAYATESLLAPVMTTILASVSKPVQPLAVGMLSPVFSFPNL